VHLEYEKTERIWLSSIGEFEEVQWLVGRNGHLDEKREGGGESKGCVLPAFVRKRPLLRQRGPEPTGEEHATVEKKKEKKRAEVCRENLSDERTEDDAEQSCQKDGAEAKTDLDQPPRRSTREETVTKRKELPRPRRELLLSGEEKGRGRRSMYELDKMRQERGYEKGTFLTAGTEEMTRNAGE